MVSWYLRQLLWCSAPVVEGFPAVFLLTYAAYVVSVVGTGYLRLQPDGELRPVAVGVRGAVE